MPAKIEQLVLPGPELEVKPLEDRRAPVVVRIIERLSARLGVSLRPGLLRPGAGRVRPEELPAAQGRLADWATCRRSRSRSSRCCRPARSSRTRAGAGAVAVAGRLSPAPGLRRARSGCAGWRRSCLLGRRKQAAGARPQASRPSTLADRLRPLVDAAVAGTLSEGQHAELERLLIGYWRKRLKLEQASPAEAIDRDARSRRGRRPAAQLEDWLHRPGARAEAGRRRRPARPYQELPAENPEMRPAPSLAGPFPDTAAGASSRELCLSLRAGLAGRSRLAAGLGLEALGRTRGAAV